MFVERDFLVKQEQINDELRRRALERQLRRATRPGPLQPLRWVRHFLRHLMPAGKRRELAGTTRSS